MRVAVSVFLILLLLSLAALANFLHYSIKIFLRLKGIEVSFWRNNVIKDIRSVREVIAAEPDPHTRYLYRRDLYLYLAIIALLIIVGLLFIVGTS